MRVGVFQCEAEFTSVAARLDQLAPQAQGLDLLICPELFLGGYCPQAAQMAEPQEGRMGQAVAKIAAQNNVAIAYGYPEAAEGAVYNAAAVYDASGRLIANHRKTLPSPGSFEKEVFAPGGCVTFADLNGWRIAMLICYEVEFPENLRQAARGGADLVIVPTALGAGWGVVARKVVPTRAYENGLWIAYADQIGEFDGRQFYGGSRIVAPDGSIVASTGRETGVAHYEIRQDWVVAARTRIPFLRDSTKIEGSYEC